MWARTREHPTENYSENILSKKTGQGWRSLFKEELETHSEQGLYLKGLRLREGYTQAEVGALIGVSPNNVSAMERGHRKIGKDIAHRLSKIFHVKYQMFL